MADKSSKEIKKAETCSSGDMKSSKLNPASNIVENHTI